LIEATDVTAPVGGASPAGEPRVERKPPRAVAPSPGRARGA